MSATTSNTDVRGYLSAHGYIPYAKYFELCSYENWSLCQYVSLIINNYKFAEKDTAHSSFFGTLQNIIDNLCISQEIREIAQKLINNKKVLVPIGASSRDYT
ncbi:8395_t:CDS:2, partial [Diversispora eburnea]